MELRENRKGLIGKYLSGKMESRDKAAFEEEMAADSQLRKEVNDLAGLYIGLEAVDMADSDHIEIELLVKYQENPSELDAKTLAKIKSHIESCSDCTKELSICSQLKADIQELEPSPHDIMYEALLVKIRRFFFTPSIRLQPVVALIAIVILAIPLYLTVFKPGLPSNQTVTKKITMVSKDAQSKNNIIIKANDTLIRMQFKAPILDRCDECRYSFNIYDSQDRLIIRKMNNPPEKEFAFELARSYFQQDGNYLLKVFETESDGVEEQEISSYWFTVQFVD